MRRVPRSVTRTDLLLPTTYHFRSYVEGAVRLLCLIRHPHALLRRAGGPRTILRRRPPLPMSLGRGLAVVGRPCRCGEAEGRNEGDRKRLHGHHEYPLTEWRGIAGSDATDRKSTRLNSSH